MLLRRLNEWNLNNCFHSLCDHENNYYCIEFGDDFIFYTSIESLACVKEMLMLTYAYRCLDSDISFTFNSIVYFNRVKLIVSSHAFLIEWLFRGIFGRVCVLRMCRKMKEKNAKYKFKFLVKFLHLLFYLLNLSDINLNVNIPFFSRLKLEIARQELLFRNWTNLQ